MRPRALISLCLVVVASTAALAQTGGRLVADTLHATALEGNKYGDNPNRSLYVYLPPGYDSSTATRYPTLYLLHGFGSTERVWVRGYRGFSVEPTMDSLIRAGAVKPMIIVMPNGMNHLGGSFYTNSESSGNWDDYISGELVSYIDHKYRTIARAESRGLAGHSMGGYGAFALGLRHGGDIYGAVYALSGCCTHFSNNVGPISAPIWETLSHLTSLADERDLQFLPQVYLALSAAFAPDVNKPPLYVDLPFEQTNGRWRRIDDVQARWTEHSPQDMIPSYGDHLRRLRGFAFDVGTRDELVAIASLDSMDMALKRAHIAHTYETYDGTHTSDIGPRLITKVLPFFSRTLDGPVMSR